MITVPGVFLRISGRSGLQFPNRSLVVEVIVKKQYGGERNDEKVKEDDVQNRIRRFPVLHKQLPGFVASCLQVQPANRVSRDEGFDRI